MSSTLAYYVLWLSVGLLLVAIASGLITRTLRRREQALALAEALARHSVWVAAQRSRIELELRREEADAALRQARRVQGRWFPRLASELAEVLEIDRRIENFLVAQHRLRIDDPEAWLESDHDERFMALWREYLVTVERVTEKLKRVTGEERQPVEEGTA
ncbi:hypothetical protein JI739_21565 [Ramlibacter sp. AW1]|uniref:DUF2489 domain-containing protein n=1 Tax=Ramlibacter aurantiacus TaxID=2801330 RepID=A0A936ZYS2_9BURK|nr:hypothetical protein [Ramlibacter aurantiacus]MBL0422939.1 hypothetical protein [Ramlibacter aurantiacus]